MSETHRPGWAKPLDESLYAPDDEEKAFMKATTGIQDDEELKKHIIAVQTKAFGVSVPVLQSFLFSGTNEREHASHSAVQVPMHSHV